MDPEWSKLFSRSAAPSSLPQKRSVRRWLLGPPHQEGTTTSPIQ